MIDMLSKILKKKFEQGPMKVEIHMGHKDDDMKKGTDQAPEVQDKLDQEPQPDDGELALLHSLTKGEGMEQRPMDRKPTFEEQAKGKMKERMASIEKSKKK